MRRSRKLILVGTILTLSYAAILLFSKFTEGMISDILTIVAVVLLLISLPIQYFNITRK